MPGRAMAKPRLLGAVLQLRMGAHSHVADARKPAAVAGVGRAERAVAAADGRVLARVGPQHQIVMVGIYRRVGG
jgi:hypothetical protein